MPRYFISLSFDGTNYHGWQRQPSACSVQQTIEQALALLLRKPIEVVGAGRTDAGVHARFMAAHFDYDDTLDTTQLTYRLNKLLPRDISIAGIMPVQPEQHARFSAKWRTYHYYIHTRKDPFCERYSCETHYPLDFEAMNEAAAWLLQVDDFAAFCKTHTDVKTTLCKVVEARWVRDDESHWHFVIRANRFLRNMVRCVVGTLFEVGRHRISQAEFRDIVSSKQRTDAGESMPAKALFLENIEY